MPDYPLNRAPGRASFAWRSLAWRRKTGTGRASALQFAPPLLPFAGQPLLAVVPLQQAYVVANYKETQLAKLVPGETVRITVDAMDNEETILGTVDSLSPASGVKSVMSVRT